MLTRFAIVLMTAAAVLMPHATAAEPNVAARLAPGQPPVIVAHRALGGGGPENSLAGIGHAIERGVDMVKIDIQLTRDGRYIVMHDPTLNRTTDVAEVYPEGPPQGPSRAARGGRDYVRDYTLAEIGRLRLTDGQDGGAHPVPTLEQALDLAEGRVMVAIGLKMYEVESLAALLAARPTGNLLLFDIYYSDPRLMHEITAATGVRALVGLSASRDPLGDLEKLAEGLGPALAMVIVRTGGMGPEILARAAELGVALCVSGLTAEDSALQYKDDTGPWAAALGSGAAAFVTARPDAVLALLGR